MTEESNATDMPDDGHYMGETVSVCDDGVLHWNVGTIVKLAGELAFVKLLYTNTTLACKRSELRDWHKGVMPNADSGVR